MKLSEKKLRELDAWLAEYIFGWSWWRFDCFKKPHGASGEQSRHIWCQLCSPDDLWYQQPQYNGQKINGPVEGISNLTDLSYFKPTTNPAAAMDVLKKCIEKESCDIRINFDSRRFYVYSAKVLTPETATTLELAICLFAKKLFSK